MKIKQYVAILYFGGEGYSVTFPDLPGCASYGLTMQSAATNAEIALNGHIGLMIRDGDPLPDPTPLDEIDPLLDPEGKDVGRVLIRAEIPEKWVRLNISMAETTAWKIDREAKERGMTRSGFLVEAARQVMEQSE